MNADGYSDGSDENNRDADNDNSIQVSVISRTPLPKRNSHNFINVFDVRVTNYNVECVRFQESMDTSEPMDKSTTPVPTTGKDQNTQKDQIDNNNSGMFMIFILNLFSIFLF